MTIYAAPGSTFEASVSKGTTGQVGTLGVRISNLATQTDFLARTTAGITEFPAASGIYARSFTAPLVAGTYSIIWDLAGVFVDEDLIISYSAPSTGSSSNPIDMCTVSDVQIRFSTADSPTGIIQQAISAASRKINAKYNREFTPLTAGQTRTFRLNDNVLVFESADLRAVNGAGVVLDPAGSPVTIQATDYRLTPTGRSTLGTYSGIKISQFLPLISGTSLAFGFAELAITGDWGCFSTITVQEDLRDAAVETVGSWLDRAVAQYASSGGLDAGAIQARPDRFAGYSIPPSAHAVFMEYDRVTVR